MARIPTVTRQVSPLTTRTTQGGPNTQASGADFGAQIGQALQGVGQDIGQVAGELAVMEDRKRKEEVANKAALFDFTPTELGIRQSAPANGAGVYEQTSTAFGDAVDNYVNGIQDDKVRDETRKTLMAQRPSIVARAAQTEFQLSTQNGQQEANDALGAVLNRMRGNATAYSTDLQAGIDVIQSRSEIPELQRNAMVAAYKQKAAAAHLEGRLEAARTPEAIDSFLAELTGKTAPAGPDERTPQWEKEVAPDDFNRLVNNAISSRKAVVTAADSHARAALDTLEARNNDNVPIDRSELNSVANVIRQSENPVTQAKFARILRDQSIMQETRKLPVSEQRALINERSGMPGTVYPGMPPRVNNAINSATSSFDVSPAFLGATVAREYGGQFKPRQAVQYDQKFTPIPIHNGVDLRNIRPDVANAAGVAGQLFGAPLPITSAYRSQQRQDQIRFSGDPNRTTVAKKSEHTDGNALDVSTAGMSEADKARLAGALVDAGFTGIGEYGTHIHADMRGAVPGSYRQGWGGWTNLSPAVQAELDKRGFAAGRSAAEIQRAANAVPSMDSGVDYGVQNPDSSATGVGQFIDSTWLQLVKDPNTARRMGLDTTNMSDAQLLELRKNPDIAIRGVAALAEQNKKQMSAALGRTVSDAELYAGHFLGAAGGVAMIRANDTNPGAVAADILPDAAKSNKNVFYAKDGTPKTVREVMGGIARQFTSAPTQVQYGDIQTMKRIADKTEQLQKSDPIQLAQQVGSVSVPSLDAGYAQRGQAAMAVANYYGIPATDMKPFTQDEAASISKQISEGGSDQVLDVMSQIQAMGGDMARAAFKQIGQTEPLFAYAASLAGDRGEQQIASDVVRGAKRIKENPDVEQSLGISPKDLNQSFNDTVGNALSGLAPRDRQAVQDAAKAHYVETYVSRAGGNGFDANAYAKSVQAVMGGRDGRPAVDTVNGEPTVVPPGMTGEEVEQALDKMTVDDWTRLSVSGEPPRYANGSVIDPRDLADEGKLRAIGNNRYQVLLSDNTFAVTGNKAANGRMELYILEGDPEALTTIAQRPTDLDSADPLTMQPAGTAPAPEDTGGAVNAVPGNALWNFDENGLWKGPVK